MEIYEIMLSLFPLLIYFLLKNQLIGENEILGNIYIIILKISVNLSTDFIYFLVFKGIFVLFLILSL